LPEPRSRFPHLQVIGSATEEPYQSPPRKINQRELPRRTPSEHAALLRQQLVAAREESERRRGDTTAIAIATADSLIVEIESEPSFDEYLRRLDSTRDGLQLLNVRPRGEEATFATLRIEGGHLKKLEKKLEQYEHETTKKKGEPKHRKLFDSIRSLRAAVLESFWTDTADFPSPDTPIWWEVWLRSGELALLDNFREAARATGIEVATEFLQFPDRIVTLAYGSVVKLAASIGVVDAIAELRRAKDNPEFFLGEGPEAVADWIDQLLQRTAIPTSDVGLCLLDTGVNYGHPVIEPFVEDDDFQTARPEWNKVDVRGHGTEMAGIALFGDLADALASTEEIQLPAALEGIKILPNSNDSHRDLHGAITRDAVSLAEIQKPDRRRVFSMAITAPDFRDHGRPSSWSAELDKLAVGAGDEAKRLLIVSAGNCYDLDSWRSHPEHLTTEEVHDPGQAWNVLTVGGMTRRWQITDPIFDGWQLVAQPGDLSPCTTTSMMWQRSWPIKPDVVFEAGNAAKDPETGEIAQPDSLRLLTTYARPQIRPFTATGDTSAACTLASRFATELMARYPGYWPETIRALVVHSAQWTPLMRQLYGPSRSRRDIENLVRHCGFGEPSIQQAMWSAENRLTLVAQDEFQPFSEGASGITMNEMHLHTLPWPREQLRELGSTEVELRVTLSYFIEPNPGERGWKYRHRYQSHALRFDVQTATESLEEFRARVNRVARDEETERTPSDTPEWLLGPTIRHRGSIHRDSWMGTAAALADRDHVAIFPVAGWWKEYRGQRRFNDRARYSLIVSIHVPEVDIDIYTPVATQIGVPIEIGS
jgi:Subtilase family